MGLISLLLWVPGRGRGLIADAVATITCLPGMNEQKTLVWASSAYCGFPSISAAANAGVDVPATAIMASTGKRAIATIPDNRWQAIQNPDAVCGEDTDRWISSDEVAEVSFIAFG